MLKSHHHNRNQKVSFKISLTIALFQEAVNILVPILIVLLPLWILVFIVYFFGAVIKDILDYVILTGYFIDALVYIWVFKPFTRTSKASYIRMWYEPETKWYGKLKSYFIRRWILKNVPCPNCNGKLSVYGELYKNPEKFMDYWYQCDECKKRFKVYPIGEAWNTYALKEIKRRK